MVSGNTSCLLINILIISLSCSYSGFSKPTEQPMDIYPIAHSNNSQTAKINVRFIYEIFKTPLQHICPLLPIHATLFYYRVIKIRKTSSVFSYILNIYYRRDIIHLKHKGGSLWFKGHEDSSIYTKLHCSTNVDLRFGNSDRQIEKNS